MAGFLASMACVNSLAIAENNEEYFDLGDDFNVITSSKMYQSLHDTPSSVTVITRNTISQLGIRSVPEALRLVPGMIVTQRPGGYRINYHGTNRSPRRMQVLIDGMSIFRVGFAIVNWSNFPVNINDIERIEVTRGPGGSTYGTNAFSAVVNIITTHPEDHTENYINAYTGDLYTRELALSHAGKFANTSYWLTLDTKSDTGFDNDDTGSAIRDDKEQDSFSFRATTSVNEDITLDYAGGILNSSIQAENIEPGQQTPGDNSIDDLFLRLNITGKINNNHEVSINMDHIESDHKQTWLSCYPGIMWTDELRAMYSANPDYAAALLANTIPTGGTAEDDALALAVLSVAAAMGADATNLACGTANQNYKDSKQNLEIIDRLVISDSLRMTTGFGINYVDFHSETYMNGSVHNKRLYIYNNTEYHYSDAITINLGLLAETEDDYMDDKVYYSPRVSVNYHINNANTLRFGVSKAIRTPDLFERQSDWSYTGANMSPQIGTDADSIFYITRSAGASLLPEEIISKEIGYYSNNADQGWFIDIRLFQEKLTQLISEPISFFAEEIDNNDQVTLDGLEFQLDYQLLSNTKASLSYAYIDSEASSIYEEVLYSEHSGSAILTTFLNRRDNISIAYYAMSASARAPYHRTDLVYNLSLFSSGKTQAMANFTIRNYNDDLQFITTSNTSSALNYKDNIQYFAGLKIRF